MTVSAAAGVCRYDFQHCVDDARARLAARRALVSERGLFSCGVDFEA